MRTKDLKPGIVYGVQKGTASWRTPEAAMLISDIAWGTRYAYLRPEGENPWEQQPTRSKYKSRYADWGFPVAEFYTSTYSEDRATLVKRIEDAGLRPGDITVKPGEQTVKGIRFRVTLRPATHFVRPWAEVVEQAEQAETAADRAEAARLAKMEHGETVVAPKLAALFAAEGRERLSYHYSVYDGKLTVYDPEVLIALIESLSTCRVCGKPIGDVCWSCA